MYLTGTRKCRKSEKSSNKEKGSGMKNIAILLLALVLIVQPAAAQIQQEDFKPEDMTTFIIQVPHGVEENGLAVRGSTLSAYVFFESYYDGNMNVTMELDLPEGFVLHETSIHSFSLQTEYDNWYRLVEFYIPEDMPCGTYTVTATAVVEVEGTKHTIVRTAQLNLASKEEVTDEISVSQLVIPSDEDGYGDPSHLSNTLVVQETSPALKKLLKVTDLKLNKEDFTSTFIGIEITNTGNSTIPVIVTYDILDTKTGEPVKAFKPEIMGISADATCYATLTLSPGSSSLISLPLYISQDAMGGDYLLRVKVKLTGSDWTAVTKEQKITAISRKWGPIITTFIASLLGLTALGFFISRSRAIMDRFKTRNLVLIALFGTVSFAAINLPMTILWELSHAIFGPFSFLFTGLFNEILLYMLIASLVVLIPKPGVVSLFMMVRFLLGGFITGSFTPITFITLSVNAIILELMLYAAGITSKNPALENRFKMGIICGFADMTSGYVSFSVWMVLYRLFYSDWYITANILIDGFLYTFIGTWFGISLGNRLKKVAE
ncbi:MAG: MptD family putative ECF transporter S component [Methanosarcina barkeri]|nr:MptD family putative ECF transporter S component [Methanosarcina sp. ERenArc_MAG2]